jgi:hypothetical protein
LNDEFSARKIEINIVKSKAIIEGLIIYRSVPNSFGNIYFEKPQPILPI